MELYVNKDAGGKWNPYKNYAHEHSQAKDVMSDAWFFKLFSNVTLHYLSLDRPVC